MDIALLKELSIGTTSKIVLVVLDGLGGLPHPETGKTELETAGKPNLDSLVKKGCCGLMDSVATGITPGSGPGHLALFGYDPLKYTIGRGALEAVGIDFDLKPSDVAARGNFCTVDSRGNIIDRRAGRISTERCRELTALLTNIKLDGVTLFVEPVQDHRFIVVFRGEGLEPATSDSDPQKTGVPPLKMVAQDSISKKTAEVANKFIEKAGGILADKHPANMVLLRGFSRYPSFPQMADVYRLKPAAIATYPMYRGLARLVGMTVLPTGKTISDEINTLKKVYNDFDFFFFHVKYTDAAGEDGDFDRKVKVIEDFDRLLPEILDLKPDVLAVTGDHSTPAVYKAHSWHPVPVVIVSRWCRRDNASRFSETDCLQGALSRMKAVELMPLLLANAQKLNKYGA